MKRTEVHKWLGVYYVSDTMRHNWLRCGRDQILENLGFHSRIKNFFGLFFLWIPLKTVPVHKFLFNERTWTRPYDSNEDSSPCPQRNCTLE